MRLILIALVVAALVAPTAVLAGSSSATSGAAASASASVAKKGKKKQKRSSRAAKKAAFQKQAAKQTSKKKSATAADEREVKGTITALGATSITVGTLTCAVPSTVSLAAFAVGDVVELTCDLVGGTWTLRKIEHESAAASGAQVEVKGSITALGGTIEVGGVSCVVPAGASLTAFAVGDFVEMKCRTVGSVLTLYRIKKEDVEDEVEVKGVIASIGGGSVTVGSTTCAIPTGAVLTGFAPGDFVEMECELVGGVLTLSKLKAEDDDDASSKAGSDDDHDDDDDDDHSGSGSGSGHDK